MTKRDEQLTTVVGGGDIAWLAGEAAVDTSLDHVRKYRKIPTVRIIQGLTKKEIKNRVGMDGTLYMNPGEIPFSGPEVWLKCVPLFSCTEFRKYSDRDEPDSMPVLERSWEENSELARTCRDFDKNSEPYGNLNDKGQQPYRYKYSEVMIYFCTVYDKAHPQYGNLFAIEFQQGSFYVGRNFASSTCSRLIQGKPAPLWAQIWEFQSQLVERKGNEYWVILPRNPEDGSLYIDQTEGADYKAMYSALKEDYDSKAIIVEGTEDAPEEKPEY
jgi:hypothetical protein